MAFTTFSGPLRTGTVKDGASRNTGLVTVAQVSPSVSYSVMLTTASVAQNLFILPAGSKILSFIVDKTTAISGGSVSNVGVTIGKTGTTDYFTQSFNIATAAGRTLTSAVDGGMNTTTYDNVGTSDVQVTATFTAATGAPTAGAVKITCVYLQRDSAGNANPTSA